MTDFTSTISQRQSIKNKNKQLDKEMTKIAYAASFFLGMTMLSGYNSLVNSFYYWMWKFSGDSELYRRSRIVVNDSDLLWQENFYQTYWTSFFEVVQEVSIWILLFFYTLFWIKNDLVKQTFIYMFIAATVQITQIIFTQINTDAWYSSFFFVALLLVAINESIVFGPFVSACFSLTGTLGYEFVNFFLAGGYFSGCFIAVASIIAGYLFEEDIIDVEGNEIKSVNQIYEGMLFFGLYLATIVITIVLFYFLVKQDYFRSKYQELIEDDATENKTNLLENVTFWQRCKIIWSENLKVLKICKITFLNIGILMASTYSVFPLVPQRVISQCNDPAIFEKMTNQSSFTGWYCDVLGGDLYPLVFCFLLTNICFWIGNSSAVKFKLFKVTQEKQFLICTTIRLIFMVPYFFFRRENYNGVSFFAYDLTFIIYTAFYNLSHGYFLALGLDHSMQLCKSPDEQTTLSNLTSWMLTLSAFVGAVLTYPMAWIIDHT